MASPEIDLDRLALVVERMRSLGIRTLRCGDLHVELGSPPQAAQARQGTVKDKLQPPSLEAQLFGSPLFAGLSDDQILGFEPLPEGHPLAELQQPNRTPVKNSST